MMWTWIKIIWTVVVAGLKAYLTKEGHRDKLESELEKLDEKIKKKRNQMRACADAGSAAYYDLCEQLGMLETKRSHIRAKLNKMPAT